MKYFLLASVVLLLFASCQKQVSTSKALQAETLASDALLPLSCHSISFATDYPIRPGEVPPYRFSKTLYPDTRVKTISMLSRVNPIYPGYQKRAVELNGTFTYASATAYLKGTSEVWEYYKTATGAGARRSVSKKSINWRLYFTEYGYCHYITNLSDIPNQPAAALLEVYYPTDRPNLIAAVNVYDKAPGNYDSAIYYNVTADQYGNILSFVSCTNCYNQGKNSYPTYTYDYNIPRGSKNYSFIPSQNLLSQAYSLLEVMQWVPPSTHQRKTVAGVFFLPNGSKVTQSQTYNNYKFDAIGNEISLTYGDNVLQKTTWYCK